MPLAPSGLATALAVLAAEPAPLAAGCAQQWADAMEGYASGIVPVSTTVAAAASALAGALTTAFESPLAAPGMETAFSAFALTISGGMSPGFVGTPPGGPVGFAAQFAGPMPTTHASAGSQLSALIQAWMTTGSATPSGGGAPSPWS